jgi:hypothetical protein
MAINALALNESELDALRGLQQGTNRLSFADPIWAELQDVGLVEARGARAGVWALTLRGRCYHTQ